MRQPLNENQRATRNESEITFTYEQNQVPKKNGFDVTHISVEF
jgi:hypothetical protein